MRAHAIGASRLPAKQGSLVGLEGGGPGAGGLDDSHQENSKLDGNHVLVSFAAIANRRRTQTRKRNSFYELGVELLRARAPMRVGGAV
jgi:hypothetical protein